MRAKDKMSFFALHQIYHNGKKLQEGINECISKHNLNSAYKCSGYPEWSLLQFKEMPSASAMLVRSLLQQELVKRGVLILATHNMTASHTDADVNKTIEAYDASLAEIQNYLQSSKPESYLKGKIIEPVFKVRS
jgi:glutamate-1-semialdehyde aminotransferase